MAGWSVKEWNTSVDFFGKKSKLLSDSDIKTSKSKQAVPYSLS